MQSWLVTIRVTDSGMEDETHAGMREYLPEGEIRAVIINAGINMTGVEITDITDIVKEK
jgi:hypothetical protein